MGLGNILIRFRLAGDFSHSEIMFEPGDGVDHLMPDKTCEPIDGAYWCCSSTGTERLPTWSPYRAGHMGGFRFKRIRPDRERWTLDATPGRCPLKAATQAKEKQGKLYDWQLVLGFIAWLIPEKAGREMCSEACASLLGFVDAWRFDPCTLRAAVLGIQPQSHLHTDERTA